MPPARAAKVKAAAMPRARGGSGRCRYRLARRRRGTSRSRRCTAPPGGTGGELPRRASLPVGGRILPCRHAR